MMTNVITKQPCNLLFFLPAPVIGVLAGTLFLLNILVMASLVILFGIIERLMPFKRLRRFFQRLSGEVVVNAWIDMNYAISKLTSNTQWVVRGEGKLHADQWYFVFANHRSWADIIIIQKVFNRKIPILKFFLKKELLWSLPMGGLACWMLGFPFMKRHSKAYLKKHPEQRNADIEATKMACNKFKLRPTSVMNFLEGTRFTQEKRKDRSSPYRHLLRPKSGGMAFVINELRNEIKEAVDVTIVYDHVEPTFWNFISGKIPRIYVDYKVIPFSQDKYGDYYNDSPFRKQFQGWVNTLWQKKDGLIDSISLENEA